MYERFRLRTVISSRVRSPAAARGPDHEARRREVGQLVIDPGSPHAPAGPIFRSQAPELIDAEHAAWICGTELIRALARAAARQAAPARRGRLAGRKVQPRQISFTCARCAALASIRAGQATSSLPAPMAGTFHRGTLRVLGKRRIVIDRSTPAPRAGAYAALIRAVRRIRARMPAK